MPHNATTHSPPGTGNTTKVSIGVIGFGVFAVVLIVIICTRKKCTKRQKRHSGSFHSHSSMESGCSPETPHMELDNICRKKEDPFPCFSVDVKNMLKNHLIEPDRLILEKIIGKGQFGCVYEGFISKDTRSSNNYGILTHEKVAVKTIKHSGDLNAETVESFLLEGMIMKDFCHPHVLGLVGVAIAETGVPMIVLPYMEHGNLKTYITDPTRILVVRQLLEFGRQVAHGMDYLGQQKFVHRDLAARNCMLDANLMVKVADFGLSRDIYTKDYYCSEDKQTKLPVKWMAIECLSRSKYSYKSDVWSFGVLLWELLTRGATPYPDVSNWDVFKYIQSGRRMRQPEACPDEIFTMMTLCWLEDPSKRPSFFHLAKDLDTILGSHDSRNPDVDYDDADADYMYMNMHVEAPEEVK